MFWKDLLIALSDARALSLHGCESNEDHMIVRVIKHNDDDDDDDDDDVDDDDHIRHHHQHHHHLHQHI